MSLIPLVLPLKANEAAALADLVYQQLEGHPLTPDLRNRFAARLPQPSSDFPKIFRRFAEIMVRDHHSGWRKPAAQLSSRHVLRRLNFHIAPIDTGAGRFAQDLDLLFSAPLK